MELHDQSALAGRLTELAVETEFSGVIDVAAGEIDITLAFGLADRAGGLPMNAGTALGVASVTKGFTALTAASLFGDESGSGVVEPSTTVRSVLPEVDFVDAAVTIEQLLSHRSGCGDYLDEEADGDVEDDVLTVAPSSLTSPGAYLPMLRPFAQREEPGHRFRYNNSGFVLLSMIIERVDLDGFHGAVERCVLEPARMDGSGFFRLDDLPEGAATGYLSDGSTNVAKLPVLGAGDGGVFTTVGDLRRFWSALLDDRIVSMRMRRFLTEELSPPAADGRGYGRGFWVGRPDGWIFLEGMDAGVSALTGTRSDGTASFSVLANTSSGAWPVAAMLVGEFTG